MVDDAADPIVPGFRVMAKKTAARRAEKTVQPMTRPTVGSFAAALVAAEPRPDDSASREAKKNYSQRLSDAIAILIASKLRKVPGFKTILPLPDGEGTESKSASGAHKKMKKSDVRLASADSGLELLVSVKTMNFRDANRYTKNMVRADHEFRAEAMDHHERFPYAVLVGLFFIPVDSCDDGRIDKSSFAHSIVTFRPRAGRDEVSDPSEKFERLFIGLYDSGKTDDDAVGFFDVMWAPPKRGRVPWPDEIANAQRGGRLLTIEQVVGEIVKAYGIRNRRFIEWADEAPLADETLEDSGDPLGDETGVDDPDDE